MIVLIFENEDAANEAMKLDWTYANNLDNTPYKEVTDALDKFEGAGQ